MLYQLFSSVVDYATYYQAVKSLTAHGHEAVGVVSVPSPSPGLDKGVCDPLTLDSFLQVVGIHVNCLRPKDVGQVFMCTAIEEILLSPTYAQSSTGWNVYTRYDAASEGEMTNDIMVYDAQTNALAVAIMGATFKSVSLKSLERILSRLNDTPHSVVHKPRPIQPVQPMQATLPPTTPTPQQEDKHMVKITPSQPSTEPHDVSQMLSSIIEMPADEITSKSTLVELGIDSLLASDVLVEIKSLFGVKFSQAEPLACANVDDLVRLVQADSTASASPQSASKVLRYDSFNTVNSEPAISSGLSDYGTDSHDSSCPADFTDDDGTSSSESDHADMDKLTDVGNTVTYTQHARDTRFSGFCNDVYPIQSRLVTQYVVAAFADLGCDLSVLVSGSTVPFITRFEPRHKMVGEQLYRILEDSKLIVRDGQNNYRRTSVPLDKSSAFDLHAVMLSQYPQHASETKLLHATSSRLSACLTSAANPIDILFGSAAARALLEDVYLNAPMFRTGTLVLVDVISSLVQTSTRKTIRILEIGARTGGTTRPLLQALSQMERPDMKIKYTFTDLSPSLVAAAKRKFTSLAASNARPERLKMEMRFTTLDIESADTKHNEHYDVILSTNCIHVTKDLVISTGNIRKLLDPVEGGLLCLVELTRNLFWFDLVFGLLEGWSRFNDGRKHALADKLIWERCLKQAGFASVNWSDDGTKEGEILRVITARALPQSQPSPEETKMETMCFKSIDGVDLMADIHYPPSDTVSSTTPRPIAIALMIHGGGHIMLSRADIRPKQTDLLLSKGFIPISIDYRLCLETTLEQGPMSDAAAALAWVRKTLPSLPLARKDIHLDGEKVVAVGWNTGGLLAMSLAWKSADFDIRPPEVVLAFYSPSDYGDPFWTRPNIPEGSEKVFPVEADLDSMVFDRRPITAYNRIGSGGG
ncbi:hypothetical protein QC762_0096920 [Podospora pseudocomata]|uniref:S-adenosyl-L-methionine-dependent N-methyltransferase n=1 Tax=Podospora pseudocomata TaxID=2093779 RepID=A0ABR0G7X6_9PEZI|nr:hypothetical protein QC762_0096920 [Podospora pseudocomata]